MNMLGKTSVAKATFDQVTVRVKPLIPAVASVTPISKISPNLLMRDGVGRTELEQRNCKVAQTHKINAVFGVVGVKSSVRFYHTDVKVPSFDSYRREVDKDPQKNYNLNEDNSANRKLFSYLIMSSGLASGVYVGKATLQAVVGVMQPSANVMALAKVEVNISEIPEGKNVTIKWRGKPLFVRHRTADEIEREAAVNLGELRDPEHDHDRAQKPEFLIVVGICTHLGCVPIAHSGMYNGYYCPCHGSHYDASGRIRKGPAPLNLEVPPHEYLSDDVIVVG